MNRNGLPSRITALLAAALATAAPASAALAQPVHAVPAQSVHDPAPAPPAGGGVAQTLTLAEALRLASARNPLLLDAAGRRLARVGDAARHSALANPQLEWRREGLGATDPVDEFVMVAVPLDVTGRRFVARAAARATERSAVADSQAVAGDVLFQAARAYHRAALGVALRQSAERQREAMVALASYDSTRWREGAVSEGTAMRAALEADRGRALAALAAADAARLHAALAQAVGVAADSLREPLPLGASTALPELTAIGALDSLQARAAVQRPELRAARSALEAAERLSTAERLGMLGDVTIGGGSRSSGGDRGGTVAIGVSLPLLDRNGPARQVAHGELLQARAALRQAELAVRAEVAAAAASYERLRTDLLPLASGAGSRGADVAQIARAAYREGGATLFELLDAQRAAAESDAAALRWLTDLQLARLDLLQALGDPLPEAF